MPISKIVKNSLEAGAAGISWQSTKTANFTAVAGEGYSVDTSSGAITMTLPSSPSVGDTVEVIDVGGSLSTNNITVARNSSNINGNAVDSVFNENNSHYICIYLSTSEGWSISKAVDSNPIPTSYLVIAGGGGTYSDGANDVASGGGGAGGYINSYASESSGDSSSTASVINLESGLTYTITVGSGGSGNNEGNNSTITQGLTTLVEATGGGAGTQTVANTNGGSGGGQTFVGENGQTRGPGTGVNFQGGDGGNSFQNNSTTYGAGGGGGASGNGGNATTSAVGDGANGLSSSITGSAVTRGGGGGGASRNYGSAGSGGTGGGGNGVNGTVSAGGNGTANTGGGAGGSFGRTTGATGGSGIVILRLATALYSGTTTGSPTVTTDGSDTILQFTGSGSYTA